MHIRISLCTKFSLNWLFWFSYQICPKREFPVKKSRLYVRPWLLLTILNFSRQWFFNVSYPSSRRDNNTSQGKAFENVTSQFEFHEAIKAPTHISDNSSSCIDLLFASQPNVIVESGVHPSLPPNCHHRIIYAKFNLQIYYPPQYDRKVWHYNNANIELIRRAVDQFNWQKRFLNKKRISDFF